MLKLKLDHYQFGQYDYGKTTSITITDEFNAVFNATGYTGVIRFLDKNKVQIVDDLPVTFTSISTGKGTFVFTATQSITIHGIAFVICEITKSGEQTSTYPVMVQIVQL